MKLLRIIAVIGMVGLVGLMFCVTSGCRKGNGNNTSGSLENDTVDHYHADLDIAMMVRSMVDAVKVGEAFDNQYDYTGLLTDGQGVPLYTDLTGAPGEWEVCVISPSEIILKNLKVGDLLTDDLRQYIAAELRLPDADIVEQIDTNEDNENEIVTYDFGTGLLRFETTDTVSSISSENKAKMLCIQIYSKNV